MKDYSIYRLICKCSARMHSRGKLIKMYGKSKVAHCPNCRKRYMIERRDDDKSEIHWKQKSA